MGLNPQHKSNNEWEFIEGEDILSYGDFLVRLYDATVGQAYTISYNGDKVDTITRADGKIQTYTWDGDNLVGISDWV